MAQYNKAGFLGYCQFCGIRMKIAESINNRIDISRLFVCKTPSCGKETYWTKEIHLARFALFEEFEKRQLEARVAAHPNTVKPDLIPRDPFIVSPVVEHSYERALTPVEPAPTTPNWPFPDWNDYANRYEPAQRAHYEAAVASWNTEHPRLARSSAPWVEEPVVEPTAAEIEFARNVEQNKAYYALEKKLKKQFKNGEITIDELDRQMRELTDGG